MIPFAKPWLDENEVEAAARVIRSGWVTAGPEVKAFEDEFAAYTGADHACAVSSATAALHLAMKAVGVVSQDEVITVSHSFIATANCIRYMGAVPVFVDIEKRTYNIDPGQIEAAITPKTRAILCVHQLGMPCNMAVIMKIALKHGLKVVEDAAPALGSEIKWDGDWQKIGRPHSDISCFSFHGRKIVTTGDGGMLTTGNKEYDDKFRLWRTHGMSMSASERHNSDTVHFEEYLELGYNYRLTDIQAAIGREQLKKLPQILKKRRYLAERYNRELDPIPGLELPLEPAGARSNWQSYCVMLPPGVDQVRVMQYMLDEGVPTRRGVQTSHLEPAYKKEPWICGSDRDMKKSGKNGLKESENARMRGLMLPMYAGLSESDQDVVIGVLKRALKKSQMA